MSAFENRWLIEGTFTTMSPMHIGSGDVTSRDALDAQIAARDAARRRRVETAGPRNQESSQHVEIASVIGVDEPNGGLLPIIPGTAIKSLLRRSIVEHQAGELAETLVGTQEWGSRLKCFDAAAERRFNGYEPPHWRRDRLTGVGSFVTIDRRTRTAADDRLFHVEYVPAGVTFLVQIGADSLRHESPDEGSELVWLLATLHRAGTGDLTLGANAAAGWGRIEWKTTALRALTTSGVARWIEHRGSRPCGYDAGEPLRPAPRAAIDAAAADLAKRWRDAANVHSAGLTLTFSSHFLVNDPSQCEKPDAAAQKADENREGKKPDHTPLLDAKRAIMLPGSSLHGALRAQAERILRTIGKPPCTLERPCPPVERVDEVPGLCLACRLFGAVGWRSPLVVHDFAGPVVPFDGDDLSLPQQEFVALDRFTGGGAPGLKFNTRSWYRPVLAGRVALDRRRLGHTKAVQALEALLVFVLRDLAEGDVPLGFGSAKGYGACSIERFEAGAVAASLGCRSMDDALKALTA